MSTSRPLKRVGSSQAVIICDRLVIHLLHSVVSTCRQGVESTFYCGQNWVQTDGEVLALQMFNDTHQTNP